MTSHVMRPPGLPASEKCTTLPTPEAARTREQQQQTGNPGNLPQEVPEVPGGGGGGEWGGGSNLRSSRNLYRKPVSL